MNKRILVVCYLIFGIGSVSAFAHKLDCNFHKEEYLEVMRVIADQANRDSMKIDVPKPKYFEHQYESPVMGLENKWDLYTSKDSVAIITIRATVRNSKSWLENFYSALVPAQGELTLENNFTWNYNLASDSAATVHIGWLIATAYLSRDILPQIESCYKNGIKNFIITGHSQGGGISFLLTAYLRNLLEEKELPNDIYLKTYSSAAPKPGNLAFVLDYEAKSYNRGSFTIVNSDDWVPQSPFSIQGFDNFTSDNPFSNLKIGFKKQSFAKRLAISYMYKRVNAPIEKSKRRMVKTVGKKIEKYVKKELPEFQSPQYCIASDYVRCGTPIVLVPNGRKYYEKMNPKVKGTIWQHHVFRSYYDLAQEL